MEVAGLVIGIAGLATVFETGCKIWLTVAKASQYGDNVANALSKLEMEFFKFQAWWVVLVQSRWQLSLGNKHRIQVGWDFRTSASINSFMRIAGIPSLTLQQLFRDYWSSFRSFWKRIEHSQLVCQRTSQQRLSQQNLALEQESLQQKAATKPL